MANATDQLNLALAGRYVIERELGAGGMATVYLAQDLKHDRKVALKVLRPELAAVIGGERFLAEIKTTANLQHPHILPLHDSGEAGGSVFYVMPFVEGESLRDHLNREKQLPVNEAVRLTREVASALDYAHRHGVIHRDIKPENILLHDGQALVADFGIALAVSSAGGTRMTETGMSLGTPHYMSPEQAMGERTLDARTDVYALGCVLYEMLTGEPPFTGPTAQAIVAKVMASEAEPVTTLRKMVPPHVAEAVHTALQKLPADRWENAAALSAALSGTAGARTTAFQVPSASAGSWRTIAVGAVVVALAAVALASWAFVGRSAEIPVREPVRFLVQLPDSARVAGAANVLTQVAISPDGGTVVYVGAGGPEYRLYRRRLASLSVEPIEGTEGAAMPFFSPDGRWLGFDQAGRIRKVDLLTGSAASVTDVQQSTLLAGATWGANDTIYFSLEGVAGLRKVAASGGAVVPVPTEDTASAFSNPSLLPGGRWLLAGRRRSSTATDNEIVAVSLAEGTTRGLVEHASWAQYVGGGSLLILTMDGVLTVATIDPDDPRVIEPPVPVGESVQMTVTFAAQLAVARNGTAVFLTGGSARNTIVQVRRDGGERTLLATPRNYQHPRYSPDGSRVAFEILNGSQGDLWIYDLSSATMTRLTFTSENLYPVWTPDGRRIAFTSRRAGVASLWWTTTDGSGQAVELLPGDVFRFPGSFTPDGRTLLFRQTSPETGMDLYALPLDSDRTLVPILVTPFNENSPQLSPDGRWLAYASDQSGRYEIYLRAYPDGGAQTQVSAAGGSEPAWSPDGRVLYYRQEGRLMAARLRLEASAQVLGRDSLFSGPYYENVRWPEFDVSPDGNRFLFVRLGASDVRMVVALNWVAGLKRGGE